MLPRSFAGQVALQSAQKGFAMFRPKRWRVGLPEFEASLAFRAGPAKAVAAVPGWGEARLTRRFNAALKTAISTPRTRGLPCHCENFMRMEGRRAFSRKSTTWGLTPRQKGELHLFRLLLVKNEEPTTPVGVLNFNCKVSWPTAYGLTPEMVDYWGPPSVELHAYLGDVWVLPSCRGQGWSDTITEAYRIALLEELDAIADRLAQVRPFNGPAHLLNVELAGDYHSQAGRRTGKRVIRELKTALKQWAKAHRMFHMTVKC